AIPDVNGRGDSVEKEIAAMREDRRYSGAHGVAALHRGLANPHTRDIGNRVQRARRQGPGLDAELARAGSVPSGLLGSRGVGTQDDEEERKAASHATPLISDIASPQAPVPRLQRPRAQEWAGRRSRALRPASAPRA